MSPSASHQPAFLQGPWGHHQGHPLPLDTWVSGGEVSLRRCHCGQGPLGSRGELHSASCRTSWLTRPCCPPLPNSLHLADPAPIWKLSFPYSWEAFLNPPFAPGSMIGSLFSTGGAGVHHPGQRCGDRPEGTLGRCLRRPGAWRPEAAWSFFSCEVGITISLSPKKESVRPRFLFMYCVLGHGTNLSVASLSSTK